VLHLALDPAPPLKRVVEVTDLLRAAAMSRLGHWHGDSMLAGKTAYGQPVSGGGHAFWLPVTDGRVIAGICLWVPAGLEPGEAEAVTGLRRIGSRDRGPVPAMTVTPVPGERPVPARLTGPGAVWETVTPFVPDGHSRARRGKPRSPERVAAGRAAAALRWAGFPPPLEITVTCGVNGWMTRRPSRPERTARPVRLRVTFAEPVTGPLAIGALSHFGLGVLTPARP
jgi:CRISPR-associated protein Csb2